MAERAERAAQNCDTLPPSPLPLPLGGRGGPFSPRRGREGGYLSQRVLGFGSNSPSTYMSTFPWGKQTYPATAAASWVV